MKILFWVSCALIVYTYFGYPVLIYILSQFYKKPVRGKYLYPTVSVILSVYNEEKNIGAKVRNLLALDYPEARFEILIGSDGSTDGTDEIIRKVMEEQRQFPLLAEGIDKAETVSASISSASPASLDKKIHFFKQEKRQGKPSMLNLLVSKAKGEVLVMVDARQRLDVDSVTELVKYFEDKRVGSVSGALQYESGADNKTGSGLGAYWEYEKFIRKSESRMGSMLGATGAFYAIRRELFPALPSDLILDDVYIPLKIVEKGYRAIFDKKAKVYDKVFGDPRDEFLRKARTLAGNFQLSVYLKELFNPFKGKISWQFFSHKFLRLMVPYCLVAMLISNYFLVGTRFYNVFFTAQVIFYTFALCGALLKRKNPLFDIPRMFCGMNVAAVVGLVRFVSGKQKVVWAKVE